MKRALGTVIAFFAATSLFAADAVVGFAPGTNVAIVARGDERSIDGFTASGEHLWKADGTSSPRSIAVSRDGERVAFVDPLSSRVVVVTTRDGHASGYRIGETPVAAMFDGRALLVVSRDASRITRIDADGRTVTAQTADDPSAIAIENGIAYVYCRTAGEIESFDAATLHRIRTMPVGRFASDFETDGQSGFLSYPQKGRITIFSLAKMKKIGDLEAGAVPVDIAVDRARNAVTAGTIAVADPSSKRLWQLERDQSEVEAFFRGFLRGLVGLGLFRPNSAEFPTGVDRVLVRDGKRLAFDSSSGTLYLVSKNKSRVIGTRIGANGFDVGAGRLFIWDSAKNVLQIRHI